MNETKTIFFVGKPGCGKGTQAKLLAEKTGWPVFGSGNLFRAIAAEDSALGRKVKGDLDAGFLMPHWFAMYLYLKTLFGVSPDSSVIFDGFNRKIAEAELVIESLKWLGRPFEILNIDVSDKEIERRLALRKDTDGRADDHAVEERLQEYYTYTNPAITLFRKEGVLTDINGERTPEAIAADIAAHLNIK